VNLSLEQPIIYLITKGEATESNFAVKRREILEIIRTAVDERISLVQLREKNLRARLIFELACEAADLVRRSDTRLLINDRADIALAAKADGVHLTSTSLPIGDIRAHFPDDFMVGASTHTLAETVDAAGGRADFAVFGPVFDSPGKGSPHGIDVLAKVCSELKPFPIIALGGIDGANCQAALEAGAAGFAAIRWLNDAASLRSISSRLIK